MATAQKTMSTVVDIKEPVKGETLMADAFRRLRRNRPATLGGIIIIIAILLAVFAGQIAPFSERDTDLANNNAAPEWITHLFPGMIPKDQPNGYITISDKYAIGADNLGRDLLSRIIYGTRISLAVAFIGPLVSIIIGLIVGMIAGYAGGRVDNILMRIVDLMYAFPTLLLIILLMTFFRTSFASPEKGTISYTIGQLDASTGGMLFIFVGIGVTSWMQMARLVRGQVLSVREKEYIEAARAIGTPQSAHHGSAHPPQHPRPPHHCRNVDHSSVYLLRSLSQLHRFRCQCTYTQLG